MPTTLEMLQALLHYLHPKYNLPRDYFLQAYQKVSGRKKERADEIIRQLYEAFIEVRTLENTYVERILNTLAGGQTRSGIERKAREDAERQLRNKFGPPFPEYPHVLDELLPKLYRYLVQ